jgi:hypothetical protein
MECINNECDNSPNSLARHRQRCSTMTTREKYLVWLSAHSEPKKHGIRAVLFELFQSAEELFQLTLPKNERCSTSDRLTLRVCGRLLLLACE